MRIGLGLPAAIPGVPGRAVGDWAAAAEEHGFSSVGVIDRLVYDNLDPLVALAVAAARTRHVELLTTVLNVPWRRNAIVLAKQLASLDDVSEGRLAAGLALGGWPEDHEVVGASHGGMGALMDEMLATMRRVWGGELNGASGPMSATPAGRPRLLFGGMAPASFARASRLGLGWVAPSFGYDTLVNGIDAMRAAWEAAQRPGAPRIVAERYFCFGTDGDDTADHYLLHYYGPEYLAAVRADSPTSVDHLDRELRRLVAAGVDDVVLLPCDGELRQVDLLTDALDAIGITNAGQQRIA
jgi:alkanesulfonate monooxygenase SsuD/methylene tetrahydromethanopterin reductase-like flavin-dependent oxidoreductase (luciferase family)